MPPAEDRAQDAGRSEDAYVINALTGEIIMRRQPVVRKGRLVERSRRTGIGRSFAVRAAQLFRGLLVKGFRT